MRAESKRTLRNGGHLEGRFGLAIPFRAHPPAAGGRERDQGPTFFETFAAGFTTGNPDLEPEHSTSFEAGLDQELGSSARLSLTGFSQSYRDLIQYTFSPPTQGGPNYHNVAKASSRGLEAEGSAGAGPFQLTASYTWLDTEVRDAGFDEGAGATFVEGEPLLRRPRHAASATAFVRVAECVGAGAEHAPYG